MTPIIISRGKKITTDGNLRLETCFKHNVSFKILQHVHIFEKNNNKGNFK